MGKGWVRLPDAGLCDRPFFLWEGADYMVQEPDYGIRGWGYCVARHTTIDGRGEVGRLIDRDKERRRG